MKLDRYYYDKMNAEEKSVYDAIKSAVESGKETVAVRTNLSIDDICVVYTYIFNDNPQWLDVSPRISFSYRGNEFIFNIERIYSQDEVNKAKKFFIEIVKEINDKCNGLEDYKKALYLAKIIIEKCTYGIPNVENGSIKSQLATSVALENKTVCAGLSRAFKYVFDQLNIECIVVNGDTIRSIVPINEKDKEQQTKEGEVDVYKALRRNYTSIKDKVSSENKVNYIAHAWNVAKIDGKYLAIDVNATQNANKDYEFRRLYNFCVPQKDLVGYIWNEKITPK